jgi:voltage-gated potassium channel Kch
VIGYGPAGQQVCQALRNNGLTPGIIELNPDAIRRAQDRNVPIHIGDATGTEVLAHAGVPDARAVIVTAPDPRVARDITAAVRSLAPQTRLIVRSRFQRAREEIKAAGATTVVDEEHTVGCILAQEALTSLELGQNAGLACALAGRTPTVTASINPKTA